MAAFRYTPEDWQRLDFIILRDGAVALYGRPEILAEDVAWLAREGYRVAEFDCQGWRSSEAMHHDLRERLAFPDYYGRNLHALNDCLGDLDIPDQGGQALVFRRFDDFAKGAGAWRPGEVGQSEAEALLDIIASNSRIFLLFGRRLIALAQTNDPNLGVGPLGAVGAAWNWRERLHRARHP